MVAAFEAGMAHGADEHTITVATGQRQLDDATSLMTEAAELLRGHEKNHKGEAFRLHCGSDAHRAQMASAETNALMAARLEAWLAGDDFYPIKPGALSADDQAAQEAFVSAALDAGIDQITEGDEPPFADRTLADCKARFHEGGFVKAPGLRAGEVPAVLSPGGRLNPIDVLREVAEGMVDGEVIKGVDGPSFDLARDYMDQPVEISALDASPFGSVQLIKGAPLTWDGGSASLLRKPGPLPPGCHCSDICMAPVMMGRQTPCRRAGGVPGQKAPPAPERVRVPGVITEARQEITYEIEGEEGLDLTQPIWINGVPYLPARQFEAKAVLAKAEILIGEAADFIRGVTGALPGSDSAEMCARLDAWPLSLATDAPTTKED